MQKKTTLQPNLFKGIMWHDICLYCYIAIPILIFFVGWLKWYIAVPASLVIIFSFGHGIFRCSPTRLPSTKGKPTVITITAALIILWVFLSGTGGFVFQNADHLWRNEIFRELVEKPWPVQKTVLVNGTETTTFLSYYIGFWFPAALFAKAFGLPAGFFFQFIWAVAGVLLVFLKISEYQKKWSITSFLFFIFFSGMDIIAHIVKGVNPLQMTFQEHLEWWCAYQFSSHTSQLFWVFNQAIYGWLLTLMILNEKENRRIVLIWSCGLLFCTFPFVGMIPYLIYRIVSNQKKKNVLSLIKSVFTIENVLGGGVIGIISFLYLKGNSAAGQSDVGTSSSTPEFSLSMAKLLFFLFVEAWIYYILIFRTQKKNPLFFISLIVLTICPFIRIGGSWDFCMRASIPSLLVLCLLVFDSLQKTWSNHRLQFWLIITVFLIGCFTPFNEFNRTIQQTIQLRSNGKEIIQYSGEDSIMNGLNFSSPVNDNFFAKYLMK